MKRYVIIAGVTFLVLSGLGAWAAASTQAIQAATGERTFGREVVEIETAIKARWLAHQEVLRAGTALYHASDEVTRDDWRNFIGGLDLNETYPGIQGVGWSIVVAHEERARHEADQSAELASYGITDYAIHPVPGHAHREDRLSSIVLLEPFDTRNRAAIGLDMWSEPNRHEAMARAEATGEPALSGKILLVQEIDENKQPGFLLYVPVYEDDGGYTTVPGTPLVGWVYSPFRAVDLMTGILRGTSTDITFEVYDGPGRDADTLLYDDDGVPSSQNGQQAAWHTDRTLAIAGHQWYIHYESTPGFEAEQRTALPAIRLIAGVTAAALVGAVILSIGRTETAAQRLALEMTAELRTSEGRRAELNRRLVASNEDLLHFAHIASHDLQEPARTVQSILGLLEMEHGETLDAEAKELLDIAKDSANRMRTLVHDLLSYSRIVGDETTPEPNGLMSAVETSWADVQASAEEGRAKLDVEGDARVLAHKSELQRIFTNLFANAIKYRRGDNTHIHVRIDVAPQHDDQVLVEVEDDGIGIAAQHHDKVFVMYERLHVGNEIPGTGMGLALCRKIVENRGGTIGVHSEYSEGSTFWFTLPRAGPEGRAGADEEGTS